MKVKSLMDKKFIKIYPDFTVQTVIDLMYKNKKFSTPIIDNDGKMVGWTTAIDLMIVSDKNIPIKDIMSPIEDVIVVNKNEPAREAVTKIVEYKVISIPVLNDDGQVVGIVRNCDITKTLSKLYDIPVHSIFKSLMGELKGISWEELMNAAAIVTKQTTGEKITGEEYERRIKGSTFGQAIWACGGLEKFFTGLIKIGEVALARKVSCKNVIKK
ncbi:CBS domain-containing protein [Methanococcus maripaludis]|uniref:CBS domain-containing protein n=1 Tax=Methanococcus maripaludis TaxID=39152 RepID=A0A2L1CBK5_METMI|nr:CBS domain-containing protein [Methanococcus maripaludis]AVB76751.1 Inosine-5'-monophosphate dehydrogenase [Methanococcus maripaludis]MBA2839750.1 CBS domain-containing protein [Methanococcus maripaludis]MBA2852327.1 CBS domain-containing protein [Methanococcus maripaludis]MBA2859468.1 CBS domain-containing protein [Methanococcus maripaludis]MBA2863260.1 CBS domain-containing protein [Methanococcus maripaludis]